MKSLIPTNKHEHNMSLYTPGRYGIYASPTSALTPVPSISTGAIGFLCILAVPANSLVSGSLLNAEFGTADEGVAEEL
jgi:hypothetical protein